MYKIIKHGIVHITSNNTVTLCGERGGFHPVLAPPVSCPICSAEFEKRVHQFAQGGGGEQR